MPLFGVINPNICFCDFGASVALLGARKEKDLEDYTLHEALLTKGEL